MGKLVLNKNKAKISGVCAGLGDYFGMDPTIIRIVFVICAVFGVGTPIVIYVLLALLMPNR